MLPGGGGGATAGRRPGRTDLVERHDVAHPRAVSDLAQREVDFVAVRPDGSRVLVQVCESLAEPRTRKREVTALAQAMAELGTRTGTIVTRDEEGTIAVDAGDIEVVPAWRFLLDVG